MSPELEAASLSSRSRAEAIESKSPASPENSSVPEQLGIVQYDAAEPAVQFGQLDLDAQYQNRGDASDANGTVDPTDSSESESRILVRTALKSEQAPKTPVQGGTANHIASEMREPSLRGSQARANGHAEGRLAAQDGSLTPLPLPDKLIDHGATHNNNASRLTTTWLSNFNLCGAKM